jgi:hypothetical protein
VTELLQPPGTGPGCSADAVTLPRSPRECAILLKTLAAAVQDWHLADRLHRRIRMESLVTESSGDFASGIKQVRLMEPALEAVEFGGPFADPEQCPPELRSSRGVIVPGSLADARRALLERGLPIVPERIDVYQLGTLLCRLVTRKSIRTYLSSPATMASVPPSLRSVIDRSIGYDEPARLESVPELIALLDEIIAQPDGPDSGAAVVNRDTGTAAAAETRLTRRVMPFHQLGHFDVLEEIGHGGMGVVYRGHDRSLDRTVAIKVLHPRFARDPAFVKRFRAEASAAAKLHHPHLVPIHFIGEDSGRHFYVMQFIDGESLAERLHRTGRLSSDEALVIMQQVLLGLGAAHRQGFVHRDIKPGNILLDRQNGSALLTDFGLACSDVTDEESGDDMVMGTAEYMSPEQARGEPVDARSDLYSTGVVLYQLLSGQTPFQARTPTGQLMRHVTEPPRPLRHITPDVDPRLTRIVDRLLEKRAADRFQSVDELLLALRPVVPGTEPPRAIPEPQSSGPRRNIAGLTAALVLVALLGLAAGFGILRHKEGTAGSTLTRHADPVRAVAFSPDGRFAVSAGGSTLSLKEAGDTALRLWDPATGRMLQQSERLPIGAEKLVVLDQPAQVVAITSAREGTGMTWAWNIDTGRQVPPSFDDPFAFHFDAVRGDGPVVIAVGNQGLVEVEHTEAGRTVRPRTKPLWPGPVRAIARADGRPESLIFAATEEAGVPVIIQWPGRSPGGRLSLPGLAGTVTALAVTADGETLVVRATETRHDVAAGDYVSAWRIASQTRLWQRGPLAAVHRSLSMNDAGTRLVTVGESVPLSGQTSVAQAVLILDVQSGHEIGRVQSGSRRIHAAAISPDGRMVILGDEEGRVVFSRLP